LTLLAHRHAYTFALSLNKKMRKTTLSIICLLLSLAPLRAQEKNDLRTSAFTLPYSLLKSTPDYKRLRINSGVMIGLSGLATGVTFMLPESISNWDRAEISSRSLGSNWWAHVSKGPVMDADNAFMNRVAHPYAGSIYYMSARGAGFSAPYSLLYSFVASTFFWEYGIEAFMEIPSLQDLIITPTQGALLGETFYLAKRAIAANNYELFDSKLLGCTAAFLIDPVNELTDYLTGGHYRRQDVFAVQLLPASFSLKIIF
jgi:hypothetical protein